MKVQSTCAGLMVLAGLISVSASANQDPVSARARAEIIGCTDPTDPAISGVARLSERRSANGIKTVDVRLFVEGLPEGRHAVHIHEVADCEPCADAGGHFDPGPNGNSSPDGNHPFHLGDLINVVVSPEGRGRIRTRSTRFTLSPGPLSLFDSDGSVFIIHADPDTFCPDGPVPGCAGEPGSRVGSSNPSKTVRNHPVRGRLDRQGPSAQDYPATSRPVKGIVHSALSRVHTDWLSKLNLSEPPGREGSTVSIDRAW